MLYNANQTKRSSLKKPGSFMRKMAVLVKKELAQQRRRESYAQQEELFDIETREGQRAATEQVIANIKSMFGDRVIDTRKQK